MQAELVDGLHPDLGTAALIAGVRARCASEPGRGLVEADKLARRAALARDRRLAGWAELCRAVCLNNSGRHPEGLAAGRKALIHFSALQEHRGVAFATRAVGVSYRKMGHMRKGLHWSRRAYEAASRPGCGEELAVIHSNIADILLESGAFLAARRWFESGLAIARANGDRRREQLLRLNLGAESACHGEHGQAMAHYRAALKLAQAIGSPGHIAACWTEIGSLLRSRGRHREAVEPLERARALARESGARNSELIAMADLAWALRGLGRRDEAAALFAAVREGSDRARYPHLEALARCGMGDLALDAGDGAGALSHAKAALAAGTLLGELRVLRQAGDIAARACTLLGDAKGARMHRAALTRLKAKSREEIARRRAWIKSLRLPTPGRRLSAGNE